MATRSFLTPEDLALLQDTWRVVLEGILGLQLPKAVEWRRWEAVVELLLRLRREARAQKNFSTADLIRDRLAEAGVKVLDFPEETLWELSE